MAKYEWVVGPDEEVDPCPMGCGNLTDDPYGGPCAACWDDCDKSGDEW